MEVIIGTAAPVYALFCDAAAQRLATAAGADLFY